jgi:hypothetical protein
MVSSALIHAASIHWKRPSRVIAPSPIDARLTGPLSQGSGPFYFRPADCGLSRAPPLQVGDQRAISSVGRALPLHGRCRRFESVIAHQFSDASAFTLVMSDTIRPHPKNAPGDFYVEDGCCLYCGVPEVTAPEMFAWDGDHCFVARQPATPRDFENMLEAMRMADLECVRYRGQAPDIVRSVVEYGQGYLLDVAPPTHLREIVRTYVTFDLTSEFSGQPTVRGVAEKLEAYLRETSDNPRVNYKFVGVRVALGVASLAYGWAEELHPIEVLRSQRVDGSFLIRHSPVVLLGTRAVSRILDAWLRSGCFQNFRWYSEDEWNSGATGRNTPF